MNSPATGDTDDAGSRNEPVRVVERFWELMRSNDFAAVGAVLADDFVCEWPQSHELIRGKDNFAAVNAGYPAQGPWAFDVESLVSDGRTVITDTVISDGTVSARAISFFTVADGVVTRLREYWPDAYAAPGNRAHLVERLD